MANPSVQFRSDDQGNGAFFMQEGDKQIAEMVFGIRHGKMVVYHTEVVPEAEGRGLAKELLAAMVAHARKEGLKVEPLCPFVHAQFRRQPGQYADLWKETI